MSFIVQIKAQNSKNYFITLEQDDSTIGNLKEKISLEIGEIFAAELSDIAEDINRTEIQRIIYQGKELKDNEIILTLPGFTKDGYASIVMHVVIKKPAEKKEMIFTKSNEDAGNPDEDARNFFISHISKHSKKYMTLFAIALITIVAKKFAPKPIQDGISSACDKLKNIILRNLPSKRP